MTKKIKFKGKVYKQPNKYPSTALPDVPISDLESALSQGFRVTRTPIRNTHEAKSELPAKVFNPESNIADIITNIIDVPQDYKDEFVENLKEHTESITRFLITKIAPFDYALESAHADTVEMLELMTGSESINLAIDKPKKIVRKALELKFLEYCFKQIGLNNVQLQNILYKQYEPTNGTSGLPQLLELLSLQKSK